MEAICNRPQNLHPNSLPDHSELPNPHPISPEDLLNQDDFVPSPRPRPICIEQVRNPDTLEQIGSLYDGILTIVANENPEMFGQVSEILLENIENPPHEGPQLSTQMLILFESTGHRTTYDHIRQRVYALEDLLDEISHRCIRNPILARLQERLSSEGAYQPPPDENMRMRLAVEIEMACDPETGSIGRCVLAEGMMAFYRYTFSL